jgi:hypothetical protein
MIMAQYSLWMPNPIQGRHSPTGQEADAPVRGDAKYVHSIEPAENPNSLKNLYVMALGDSDISELKGDQIHYIAKSIEELLSYH